MFPTQRNREYIGKTSEIKSKISQFEKSGRSRACEARPRPRIDEHPSRRWQSEAPLRIGCAAISPLTDAREESGAVLRSAHGVRDAVRAFHLIPMFLLIPTRDAQASIASLSLALLERHWPDHPPVEILRADSSGSFWLGPIRHFLQRRDEELLLLMLDDYGLCAEPRTDLIEQAEEMMGKDPSIGFFPLCWYPAARRAHRPGWPGMITLSGTPILLQAAIWRRSWFLQLAEQMDDATSPWSFETIATQRAKVHRAQICAADIPEPRHRGGHLIDGLDKSDWPLPYHNLMHRGEPELGHERFLRQQGLEFPSRGLGDAVARMAERVGITAVVDRITHATGRDCGCRARREALNRWVPF
jgi:hypothetical protein